MNLIEPKKNSMQCIIIVFVQHTTMHLKETLLLTTAASSSSLLAYSQAASSSNNGRKGFFPRDVTSLCAFSSWRHLPPKPTLFPLTTASTSWSCRQQCNSPRSSIAMTVKSSSSVTSSSTPLIEPGSARLIIIIGGSGFLGTEIRRQLQERGVKYIATTTPTTFKRMNEINGTDNKKDKFVPLDLTAEGAQEDFYNIVSSASMQGGGDDDDGTSTKEIAVIAAMGTIGARDDKKVNAALAEAIKGSHRVNVDAVGKGGDSVDDVVKCFVMIGNTKRVRRLARRVSFLKGYAEGKDEAEATLQDLFGSRGCIIKPSFIYGGKDVSLTPPRVPKNLGDLASEVLGLYPIQALADELPDALALPLAPPISVEMVASAAINVALGIVEGYTEELEGKEAIVMAGSVRSWKEKSRYENLLREEYLNSMESGEDGSSAYTSVKNSCSLDAVMEISDERRWERINELKDVLLRRNGNENINDDMDIEAMEELECLRPKSMVPAIDPKLNGRWNFVLSKDDLGTQLIKELLPPDYHSMGGDNDNGWSGESSSPPWKSLLSSAYQLQGLYMRIHDEQSQVEIVLSSKLFFGQIPLEIVFSTSLLATNYDEETSGLLFLEKFEDIELRFAKSGWKLPIPSTWQRFRHLEITYLDEEILIARGSGGEPHFLLSGG